MSEQKQTAPAEELRRQFMDHSTPLNEAGHWARRHIEQLEAENKRLKTVPMKYRRLEFNAQLQNENDELRAKVAALEAEQKTMNLDELHEQGLVSRYDMISEANNYRG